MTPLSAGCRLATLLADVRSEVILEAGHMLPVEAPDQVLDALRGFLMQPGRYNPADSRRCRYSR
ncbi:MAG: hypothetical protein KDI44_13250 [Thiothrix sp.]|nr:hypothetical protein [Thiothrix sp.]HPQ97547.1 alpha/beta hydrolase [Thiolinea sp.]